MPKGVCIPESMCWTVVWMTSSGFTPGQICAMTEVSLRQQHCIMTQWRETNNVVPAGRHLPRGWPWHLSAIDVAVSFFLSLYLPASIVTSGATVSARISWLILWLIPWRTQRFSWDHLWYQGFSVNCMESSDTLWIPYEKGDFHCICLFSAASLNWYLQMTRKAIERSVCKQAEYIYHIGSVYSSEQPVFVDESSADCWTTYRGYTWAICGQKAVRKAFFIRGTRYVPLITHERLCGADYWARYSILPALSLDGILSVDIVEGSFNKVRFACFIDGLLDQMNPYPLPNSVIIMDNCRIHKCPEVLDMITARYVCTHYQMAYDWWTFHYQRNAIQISATLLSGL